MLRKLMKYELRATGRVMGPLYLLVLLLAAASHLFARIMVGSDHFFLNLLGMLMSLAFGLAILGTCLMTLVLMIRRFQKNLLGDEGYLMLTLPVSVHQHVLSKLLVSALWFFLTGLIVLVSMSFLAFGLRDFWAWRDVCRSVWAAVVSLPEDLRWTGVLLAVESFLLLFVGGCTACLEIYASLAMGHSRPRHKLAWSVGAFFAIQFVSQYLLGVVMQGIVYSTLGGFFQSPPQLVLLGSILGTAAYGMIFYAITTFFLKKRLNLE